MHSVVASRDRAQTLGVMPMAENPLGKAVAYPESYSPGSLYPIPRWPGRSLLDIDKKLTMYGFDRWRAYEISWLNLQGQPQAAIGELLFDARSANMVESKSLKLYLHSLSSEKFKDHAALGRVIAGDLTKITESEVVVNLLPLREMTQPASLNILPGNDLDKLCVDIDQQSPNPELLTCGTDRVCDEILSSNIFRSNCPMTGQPDWASVVVQYSGPKIMPQSLLRYVCSFRRHQAYHEECAEQMFRDLMLQCEPESLVIGLLYTRRGGLDINPFRSNRPLSPSAFELRLARQ